MRTFTEEEIYPLTFIGRGGYSEKYVLGEWGLADSLYKSGSISNKANYFKTMYEFLGLGILEKVGQDICLTAKGQKLVETL